MNKIKGLDGLRAISVVLVILTHLHVHLAAKNAGWINDGAAPIFSGETGVQIFFVLSGFLITSLLIKEFDSTGTVSLRNFYIRRALRILPLYFLCVGLTFAVDAFVWPVASNPALLFAATFNTSFIPRAWYSSILGHTWSLSVEEHFYIFWPAALLLFYRFALGRAARHLLIAITISLIGAAFAARSDALSNAFFVGRWSVFAGAWIAIGCLAAIIVFGNRYAKLNAFLKTRGGLALACVLFLHSVVVGELPYPLSHLLRVTGVAILICWIFYHQNGRLVAALEYGPLAYTGKISYGLYMWQGFFLSTGPTRAPEQLWPPNPLIGLALLWIVAPLSYHLFEKRFLSLSGSFRRSATRPLTAGESTS